MLVVERVRALCFRGPVDVEPVLKAFRASPALEHRRALVEALEGTYVGRAIAPIAGDGDSALDVDVEESLLDARGEIARGLQAIRIGATVSTFLGFVGAAIELTWIHAGDHGLLGLDPSRVTAMGMNAAALSIALGVGGSSFALGSWMTLRAQAKRLVGECERTIDRIRPPLRR
ncbi:MAG: hypothetical protein M3Y87_32030 [Myxococcota bacterium]|nr:hypothetical protein [Myxococcota bacterium]